MTADRYGRLLELAGPVSRETFDCLTAFEEEFKRWSARINLAASSTLPVLWERHILDSAQLLRLAPRCRHWLDLGSGGGFPGAVIAILLKDQENAAVDLIESSSKKASFLRTILGRLHAPARVHAQRIQEARIQPPDVVTARALAPLPQLLDLASPWLRLEARGLFHKGRGYQQEIEESRDAWRFDVVEHPSAVSPDSVILEITRVHRR